MDGEPRIVLVDTEAGGLSVRVNFGLHAGRQATPAELEALGHVLVGEFGDASIIAEERHELSSHSEAALHQVRIELAQPALDIEARQRLLDAAERWARACAAERHAEVTEL